MNKYLTTYDFLQSTVTCTKSVFILANSADPDETPRFVASHMGLRCLFICSLFEPIQPVP